MKMLMLTLPFMVRDLIAEEVRDLIAEEVSYLLFLLCVHYVELIYIPCCRLGVEYLPTAAVFEIH